MIVEFINEMKQRTEESKSTHIIVIYVHSVRLDTTENQELVFILENHYIINSIEFLEYQLPFFKNNFSITVKLKDSIIINCSNQLREIEKDREEGKRFTLFYRSRWLQTLCIIHTVTLFFIHEELKMM